MWHLRIKSSFGLRAWLNLVPNLPSFGDNLSMTPKSKQMKELLRLVSETYRRTPYKHKPKTHQNTELPSFVSSLTQQQCTTRNPNPLEHRNNPTSSLTQHSDPNNKFLSLRDIHQTPYEHKPNTNQSNQNLRQKRKKLASIFLIFSHF